MNEEKKNIKEDEIDLREIFMIFIRRKWWFIGSVLLVLIIGFLYIFLKPVNYLLTYQIEVRENYSNKNLSELYPDYEKDLNYFTLVNVPVIFKSEQIFESVKNIGKEIDYNNLLKSNSVVISLNENTSIFNISISNPDYDLADKIAKTLISEFDNFVKSKNEIIFKEVLEKIRTDTGYLENENDYLKNTTINNLENEIDNLYKKLKKYIIDFNIGLSNELEKNKKGENIYFYNIIIPPNVISDEISVTQNKINTYRQKILENENKLINLNSLYESLLKDENIILKRINLVSENPFFYEIESNRLRNIAIVLVLSVIIGIIFTFFINFLLSFKTKKIKK